MLKKLDAFCRQFFTAIVVGMCSGLLMSALFIGFLQIALNPISNGDVLSQRLTIPDTCDYPAYTLTVDRGDQAVLLSTPSCTARVSYAATANCEFLYVFWLKNNHDLVPVFLHATQDGSQVVVTYRCVKRGTGVGG